MCGRFTLTTTDIEALARDLGAQVDRAAAALHRPRWNVAPSDEHWVVVVGEGRRRLVRARFGLDGARGELLVNARSETAHRLPSFRRAFAEGRCLVPADGFYEWRGGAGRRRPLWFHPAGGGSMVLAGLAAPLPGGRCAFAILTTVASGAVRDVHDRMPVILPGADAAASWLDRGDPATLRPAQDGWLAVREVSPRVNAVTNDDPALLDAPPPEPQLELL